ncbi:hypothetical protein [Streptomyces sp. TRM49041]|uniref:hypothetical protein n=1 Tax=Streptomyces sp. TRM49041 TaxID=2603216 RepID=UPI0011EF51BC|nr:hypothetical protein [Streptomyces sp. TRM49041]
MTNDTEERLIRALAARAEQVTAHSLRPAAPPAPNWAARGRGPLILALAAATASVALLSTAAVSLLATPEKAPVAGTPSEVSAPPSLTTRPEASEDPPPATPAAPVSPGGGESSRDTAPPVSRSVTVVFAETGKPLTLRTGGEAVTFTVTITNNTGVTVQDAADILTIRPEGGAAGALGAGDIKVSRLGPDGRWQAVGSAGSSGYEARLASGALEESEERTHTLRIALGESFPTGVSRLQAAVFSNGGGESVTLDG